MKSIKINSSSIVKLKVKPSNIVAIATGDQKWKMYNRGGDWNSYA